MTVESPVKMSMWCYADQLLKTWTHQTGLPIWSSSSWLPRRDAWMTQSGSPQSCDSVWNGNRTPAATGLHTWSLPHTTLMNFQRWYPAWWCVHKVSSDEAHNTHSLGRADLHHTNTYYRQGSEYVIARLLVQSTLDGIRWSWESIWPKSSRGGRRGP